MNEQKEWRKSLKEWQKSWKSEWRKETGDSAKSPRHKALRLLDRLWPLIWMAFWAFIGYLAYRYVPIARPVFDDIFTSSKNLLDRVIQMVSSLN